MRVVSLNGLISLFTGCNGGKCQYQTLKLNELAWPTMMKMWNISKCTSFKLSLLKSVLNFAGGKRLLEESSGYLPLNGAPVSVDILDDVL